MTPNTARPSKAEVDHRIKKSLERYPIVQWAYLFGSACGSEDFSDVDVAVMLHDEATEAVALGEIIADLEAAMGDVPVDVTDLASAAAPLVGRIVREGRLLVDRTPDARVRWEITSNQRALDLEPWLARQDQLRSKALRSKAG